MSDLMNTILNRRSVRKYTGEEVPEEKLKAVLQAGLLAPTSMNKKPCQFYVVRDRETLKKLSKAKKVGAGFLSDATVGIAVFADSGKSDVWVEDCSVAMSYMNLMAAEQGLGSCWCQMHLRSTLTGKDAEENVRKALDVPDTYRIVGVLALGIPAQAAKPHTLDDVDYSKVHEV
ncbi:MAG: nitroreductase family protein [Coriobacteriales bacterium]